MLEASERVIASLFYDQEREFLPYIYVKQNNVRFLIAESCLTHFMQHILGDGLLVSLEASNVYVAMNVHSM